MISRLLTFLLIILSVAVCSCSSSGDPVSDIASALEAGNPALAQHRADKLLSDSVAFNALTAPQLCRLSQLMMHLDPDAENQANDASAARCLARARALQPDSVTAFLYSLSGDDAGRLFVLDRVGSYLEIPRDSLVTADEATADSIPHSHE